MTADPFPPGTFVRVGRPGGLRILGRVSGESNRYYGVEYMTVSGVIKQMSHYVTADELERADLTPDETLRWCMARLG